MYNYAEVGTFNTLDFVENNEEDMGYFRPLSMDIIKVLFKYRELYKRFKFLKALNVTTRLLNATQSSVHSEFYSPKNKVYLWEYMKVLNDPDNQIDFFLFCDQPLLQIKNPYIGNVLTELELYKIRIIPVAKNLYPEFNMILEDADKLLEHAISEIRHKIHIFKPKKTLIVTEGPEFNRQKLLLTTPKPKNPVL